MGYRYIRYEVVPLGEFLAEIYQHWDQKGTYVQRQNGKWVGCTSLRLKTFGRDARERNGKIVCIGCGLEATHFAVESSPGSVSTHINLYGAKEVENQTVEILFTHDHILARGLGGADDLSNAQVMCSPCNNKKSIGEGKEAQRRCRLKKALNEQANDSI